MRNKIILLFSILLLLSEIACAGTYKVQPGDTLKILARRYNTTVRELMSLNELNGELIKIGQKLNVPDVQNKETTTTGRASPATTPQKTGAPTRSSEATATSRAIHATIRPDDYRGETSLLRSGHISPINRTATSETEIVFRVPRRILVGYKVKSGDTLLGLAFRFHTSVKELKRINSFKTDVIRLSQVMKVPSYRMEEVRLPRKELVIDTGILSETGCIDTRPYELVQIAKEYQGTPYKRGGESPYRVDCSGFVRMLFKCFEIFLPRTSREQFKVGEEVRTVTVGDLLFFATRRATRVNHVGIYIGDNQFIHASSANGKVVVSPLSSYYKNRFRGARRVWEFFAQKKDSVDE